MSLMTLCRKVCGVDSEEKNATKENRYEQYIIDAHTMSLLEPERFRVYCRSFRLEATAFLSIYLNHVDETDKHIYLEYLYCKDIDLLAKTMDISTEYAMSSLSNFISGFAKYYKLMQDNCIQVDEKATETFLHMMFSGMTDEYMSYVYGYNVIDLRVIQALVEELFIVPSTQVA